MAKKNIKEPYKYKDLKVYGSLESLHQGTRKYRHVFDQSECKYINVELSFYNILFDEEDWDAKVRLRAVDQVTGKEICSLEKDVHVSSELNIVYIRDGWGTPDVGWWKKGSYLWEAYIDGKSVGQKRFYITDGGVPTRTSNPYFKIKAIKLFESPPEGLPMDERVYLQTFNSATTRYINIEMTLENKRAMEKHFPLELKFSIYNDTRELKGQLHYFKSTHDRRKTLLLDIGYGTHTPGFWFVDNYTIEIVFMNQLIAVVPFQVADEEVRYDGDGIENIADENLETPESEEPIYTFEEAKAELEQLIGLEEVKGKINEISTYLRFVKLRGKKELYRAKGLQFAQHFYGKPGHRQNHCCQNVGQNLQKPRAA